MSFHLVTSFIDRLADLPPSEWVAIGRAAVDDRTTAAARSTSAVIVDATIAHWQLGVAAWYVRDAIETIAFLARNTTHGLSRADRRMFLVAQLAAEDVALALLVQPCLPAQDFDVLCAPFDARNLGATITTEPRRRKIA